MVGALADFSGDTVRNSAAQDLIDVTDVGRALATPLQAWGPPVNGALRKALENPWLARTVSFLPIVALLVVLWLCQPNPIPSAKGIAAMPWWAPLGGLMGTFAVIMGPLLVNKIGAGPFAGLIITATS
jgi:transporter family-2 protein